MIGLEPVGGPARPTDLDPAKREVVYLKKPKGAKSNFRDFGRETEISLKFQVGGEISIKASNIDDLESVGPMML